MAKEERERTGFLLGINSIVNVNGIRARLEVDSATGNIHVIPVDKDGQLTRGNSVPVCDNGLSLSDTHCLQQSVSSANQPSPPQTLCLDNRTQETQRKQTYPSIDGITDSRESSEPTAPLQNIFGAAHKANGLLDSHTGQSGGLHSIEDREGNALEEQTTLNKCPQAHAGMGCSRVDQHLERDVLEQDLLEQFLSSVTHDFAFTNSVPSEPPNTSIEQNLFLTSTKSTTNNLVGLDSSKGILVSPCPFFAETELRVVDSTLKNVSDSQSDLSLCHPDVEKNTSFNDWPFQAEPEKLESYTPRQIPIENQLIKGDVSKESQVRRKSFGKSEQIVKKRGRKPKCQTTSHKWKLLRPKPILQKIFIINVPATSSDVTSVNVPQHTVVNDDSSTENENNLPKQRLEQIKNTKLKTVPHIPKNLFPDRVNVLPVPRRIPNLPQDCDSKNNLKSHNSNNKGHTVKCSENDNVTLATCPVCHVESVASEFRAHLLTHPNLCAVCEAVFDVEGNLFQHLTNHNIDVVTDEDGSTELRCRTCQSQFLHAANAQRHILGQCKHAMNTGESVSTKEFTGCFLGSKKKAAHPKKIICYKCGKLLGSKSLAVHVRLHCPADDPGRHTTPVQCNECKNLFLNLTTLKRHLSGCRGRLAEVVPEAASVTCEGCLKSVSIHSLSTHRRLYCAAAKPDRQECSFCGTVLKHKHSLRNHIRWHCKKSPSADSPTRCVCSKVFKNYKAFQSHYQNHCLVRGPAVTDEES